MQWNHMIVFSAIFSVPHKRICAHEPKHVCTYEMHVCTYEMHACMVSSNLGAIVFFMLEKLLEVWYYASDCETSQ